MRILHILDHSIPLHSGYSFRTKAILQHQRQMGLETFHLTSPKQGRVEAPLERVDGLDFYRSPCPNRALLRLPIINQGVCTRALEKRLAAVVREVRPNILHAHSPALIGLAALRVARREGIPLVYEVRAFWEDAAVDHGTCREWGPRYRLTRALESYVLRNANAVTTICEGLRLEMIGRGLPQQKITVTPNAVDLDNFTALTVRDETLQQAQGLQGMVVLGFIGSFYAYEGLDLLVDAFATPAQGAPELRLLLVGGGPQEQALKTKVNAHGLGDRVLFTGRVPHEQIQRYYSLVDILVYPRKSMRLTDLVTPLKPLEAMAQKKLLIASDVGGHREFIRHGETGRLFKSGDVEALVASIDQLSKDKASWERIKVAGRRFVEQERNWPNSVGSYRAVYRAASNDARLPKKHPDRSYMDSDYE